MTSAEVSSKVSYNAEPAQGIMTYVLTYTKLTQNDTIAVATYTPIKTILFAKAQIDADGTDDTLTWSGTAITLTGSGTGAGRLIVMGKGQ